ncbi:MAG: DUF3098 domain-containing protein [Prevotella sp.]|nr:DUF3098 domain-containing protein [Prevotella sp.]
MKEKDTVKVGRSDPQPPHSGDSKKNLAFGKVNFILLAVGMAVVIIGFLLMSGSGSTETDYNPDIFSPLRIKVAPVVCFVGFVSMIYAVIRRPRDNKQ